MEQYYVDIVIVAVMAAAVAIGAWRGLVRGLISLAALVASLLGAGWCAGNLSPVVVEKVQPLLTDKIATALENGQTAGTSGLIDTVIDAVGQANWEMAQQVVQSVGFDKAMEMLGTAGMNTVNTMMQETLQPIVHTAVFVIAFLALRIVLGLVTIPLRLVDKLPVVHGLSHLGGAVLGALSGAVFVSVGLWACERFTLLAPDMTQTSVLTPIFAGGAWLEYILALF